MMSEQGQGLSIPSTIQGYVHQQQNSNSNPTFSPNPNPNPVKRKRSLPGTPDPDAEVIALSPKSLMATNRFVCEICNKGFQRDQNLQLHRRGHNLPWKLKQRSNKEVVRRKVYVCPENTCVHHNPARALGDLTGIKKHYSRKHGEKKWKCEKCSKKYAVQSDWKAHSKICGTREYKCDCGTLFSRKDSFITHRAFCDALAEQSVRLNSVPAGCSNFTSDIISGANLQTPRVPHVLPGFDHHPAEFSGLQVPFGSNFISNSDEQKPRLPLWQDPLSLPSNSNANFSPGTANLPDSMQTMNMFGPSSQSQTQWLNNRYPSDADKTFTSAILTVSAVPHGQLKQEELDEQNKGSLSRSFTCLYSNNQNHHQQQQQQQQGTAAHMSATALLQKAAQMGSTTRNNNDAAFNTNTVFGLDSSFNSSYNNIHSGNVEVQIFLKQANANGNGSILTNNSNPSLPFFDTSKPNLDLIVLNDQKQSSLTRDFLGVGGGEDSINRPFFQQELAKFVAMSSDMDMTQYRGRSTGF
ncbi:Zinc finger protein [Quillaja saponaria]|uniref:Zinc finger protein n=1 Tax=Quillaja saponaria TaxID=32244 RepID=A0AAD7PAK1_QUISA|nr:Zinc finger protein [Quillaja saponaria]